MGFVMSKVPIHELVRPQRMLNAMLCDLFRHAQKRRALHDDEHLPPLPIYGSARMYDRVPLALMRERRNPYFTRLYFNLPVPTFNPEHSE